MVARGRRYAPMARYPALPGAMARYPASCFRDVPGPLWPMEGEVNSPSLALILLSGLKRRCTPKGCGGYK